MEQKPETTSQLSVNILKVSIPVTLTMVVFMLMEIISVAFNGHTEIPEMLAGAGLGGMYCTILVMALSIGLNSALTTLVS